MSASVLQKGAGCAIAEVQDSNFSLNTPSHVPIVTTKILDLLIGKLPQEARKAFQLDVIPHNLVAVSTLVDEGCSFKWAFNINMNGETIYK